MPIIMTTQKMKLLTLRDVHILEMTKYMFAGSTGIVPSLFMNIIINFWDRHTYNSFHKYIWLAERLTIRNIYHNRERYTGTKFRLRLGGGSVRYMDGRKILFIIEDNKGRLLTSRSILSGFGKKTVQWIQGHSK